MIAAEVVQRIWPLAVYLSSILFIVTPHFQVLNGCPCPHSSRPTPDSQSRASSHVAAISFLANCGGFAPAIELGFYGFVDRPTPVVMGDRGR